MDRWMLTGCFFSNFRWVRLPVLLSAQDYLQKFPAITWKKFSVGLYSAFRFIFFISNSSFNSPVSRHSDRDTFSERDKQLFKPYVQLPWALVIHRRSILQPWEGRRSQGPSSASFFADLQNFQADWSRSIEESVPIEATKPICWKSFLVEDSRD